MGSYLVVDGKENNSKSISYPMIDLMRESLHKKKKLSDESFSLTKKEVSIILYNLTLLLDEKEFLLKYIDIHSNEYGMDKDFMEIKDTFEWMQRCFAKTLCEMVMNKKKYVYCEWE